VRAAGRSRRAWGWHPLTDSWARRIVADATIRRGQLVVDVGAGDGALTKHLVAAGALVIAVELHPLRAQRLRDRFPDVTVVQADLARFHWPHRPFRVVASPPFGLTGELMRALLAPGSRLVAADLVLQRAVVRKYVEGRAAGANRWLRRWDVTLGRPLPRSAFRPPPQVDSGVLVVRRR
jgi:23S rRNA (adenine-N6)-dimethyltransferase